MNATLDDEVLDPTGDRTPGSPPALALPSAVRSPTPLRGVSDRKGGTDSAPSRPRALESEIVI